MVRRIKCLQRYPCSLSLLYPYALQAVNECVTIQVRGLGRCDWVVGIEVERLCWLDWVDFLVITEAHGNMRVRALVMHKDGVIQGCVPERLRKESLIYPGPSKENPALLNPFLSLMPKDFFFFIFLFLFFALF